MPSYEDDTRKVQTAVTGRPGSDQPVFLPFDHDDFDGFMRGRSRDDFYCGILLAGCGRWNRHGFSPPTRSKPRANRQRPPHSAGSLPTDRSRWYAETNTEVGPGRGRHPKYSEFRRH